MIVIFSRLWLNKTISDLWKIKYEFQKISLFKILVKNIYITSIEQGNIAWNLLKGSQLKPCLSKLGKWLNIWCLTAFWRQTDVKNQCQNSDMTSINQTLNITIPRLVALFDTMHGVKNLTGFVASVMDYSQKYFHQLRNNQF